MQNDYEKTFITFSYVLKNKLTAIESINVENLYLL